jgi:hypothetical protein
MFDVQRTAGEVFEIYRHLLDASCPRPLEFDSMAYLRALGGPGSSQKPDRSPN